MRRRAAALAAGALLGATTVLGATPTPVAAAPADSDTLVFVPAFGGEPVVLARNGTTIQADELAATDTIIPGDFSAAPGTDLFLYNSTGTRDHILHVTPTGTGATTSARQETVNGFYATPVAGDFDGNGLDDIFWYGGPDEPDSIWLFQPDGSHQTVWFTITGQYLPVVLDSNGDGYDDVVWYGWGTAPDSMWLFGPGATHTTRSLRVDGYYQPLVGHFGGVPVGGPQEQLLWYAGFGPDSVWTFTAGGKVSRSLPNENGAQPVVGDLAGNDHDAVFWYRPGGAVDTATGFADGGAPVPIAAPQVRGTYTPRVGDFDGDGHGDIAWYREGAATIWHSDPTVATYRQTAVSTRNRMAAPAVTHP